MLVGNLKIEDETCIKIYDPETKTLIGIFEDYKTAAKKLGMERKEVYKGCLSKLKRFSPTLNKMVAIRLANKKKLNDTTVKSNN